MNETFVILRNDDTQKLYPLVYTHVEPTFEQFMAGTSWGRHYTLLAKMTLEQAHKEGFPFDERQLVRAAQWATAWLAKHPQGQVQTPAQDTQAQVEKAIEKTLTGTPISAADAAMVQRDKDAIAARKPAPPKHQPTAPREPRPLAAALMLDPDYTSPLVSPAWGLAAVTSR